MLSEYLTHVGRINVYLDPNTTPHPKRVGDVPCSLPLALSKNEPVVAVQRDDTLQVVIRCSPRIQNFDIVVPLKALDFDSHLKQVVQCRYCSAELATFFSCRDLPSANWQELMDCWACHVDFPATLAKNGGMPSFTPTQDMSYSGISFLLLHPNSLENPQSYQSNSPLYHCSSCQAALGVQDEQDVCESVRLDKSCIMINGTRIHPSYVVTSELLTLRELNAVHKFCLTDQRNTLFVWCFTPYLPVTFFNNPKLTASFQQSPVITVKTLYTYDPPENSQADDWQDITLVPSVFQEIKDLLELTTSSFPSSAQKFQFWYVGLLPRL
ncbi:cleavage and polyadenylation HECT-type ubiquitin-protein ligase E3 Ipa1 [Schizosaccharomyces osmophilus]|uniref:Cleavage and polyadenylation HECT-type ubiquitin-protein ligase E3 Ipa1 n=1 Tax=Schizosaccharomyces osmophilus TaxID=2545709 RepID=A0AAF0AV75_9SCHI|nr:cleavage and polyadenylation HECT-type ubiquitin-protein ligase E3 Ipa1 [Schizosaccharomyces osmophilus]WBW72108.1 cleavage and polyadenylation HECT-type ubiquitin-protein ligase E3 Ipa1 [Schizosaccharomyces osmophilus]